MCCTHFALMHFAISICLHPLRQVNGPSTKDTLVPMWLFVTLNYSRANTFFGCDTANERPNAFIVNFRNIMTESHLRFQSWAFAQRGGCVWSYNSGITLKKAAANHPWDCWWFANWLTNGRSRGRPLRPAIVCRLKMSKYHVFANFGQFNSNRKRCLSSLTPFFALLRNDVKFNQKNTGRISQ